VSTYHNSSSKPCHSLEDAAEYFREHQTPPESREKAAVVGWTKLEPMGMGAQCPWCNKGGMRITQVTIEERIQTLIGGYRIAECQACGALAVTHAKQAYWNKRNEDTAAKERADREKHQAWLLTTEAKEYFLMLRAWEAKCKQELDRVGRVWEWRAA
jgi:hypothetical protein